MGNFTATKDLALNASTVLVTAVAVAVGSIRVYEHFQVRDSDVLRTVKVKSYQRYQAVGHRLGPSNASVTVVEFADFQCPYCAAAARELHTLRARYPEVAVVYRHYPLAAHPSAFAAAVAAVCADRFGRFEPFHDALFLQRDSLGKKAWSEFARDVGISDTAAFRTCLADSSALAQVNADRKDAQTLGIEGTPVFLINDLEVPGYPVKVRLEEYIRAALRR